MKNVYLGKVEVVYPPKRVESEMCVVEAASEQEALELLKTWAKTKYSKRRDCYIKQGSEVIFPYITA